MGKGTETFGVHYMLHDEGRSLVQETTWRREGEAMLQAGLELQRIALTLPVESVARAELLQDAKHRFTAARVRGITT